MEGFFVFGFALTITPVAGPSFPLRLSWSLMAARECFTGSNIPHDIGSAAGRESVLRENGRGAHRGGSRGASELRVDGLLAELDQGRLETGAERLQGAAGDSHPHLRQLG